MNKNKLPVLTLTACKYRDLPKSCPVINKNELEYYMWIHIDPDMVRGCCFNEAYEILDGSMKRCEDNVFKWESKCWISSRTDLLNKTHGLHTYRLSFVRIHDSAAVSIYFNYIIQDDNPEKPYIYMKETEDEDNN